MTSDIIISVFRVLLTTVGMERLTNSNSSQAALPLFRLTDLGVPVDAGSPAPNKEGELTGKENIISYANYLFH